MITDEKTGKIKVIEFEDSKLIELAVFFIYRVEGGFWHKDGDILTSDAVYELDNLPQETKNKLRNMAYKKKATNYLNKQWIKEKW